MNYLTSLLVVALLALGSMAFVGLDGSSTGYVQGQSASLLYYQSDLEIKCEMLKFAAESGENVPLRVKQICSDYFVLIP